MDRRRVGWTIPGSLLCACAWAYAPAAAAELPFGTRWQVTESARAWKQSGKSIAMTAAGRVVAAASFQDAASDPYCSIRRFDDAGGLEWESLLPTDCHSLATDPLGNAFAVASPFLDQAGDPAFAVKLDPDGNVAWTVELDHHVLWEYNRFARRPLVLDPTGSPVFPVMSRTDPAVNEIVKLDASSGAVVWTHDLQSSTVLEMVHADGRFHYLATEPGGSAYFLRALDSDGGTLWTLPLAGPALGLVARFDRVCYSSRTLLAPGESLTALTCRSATNGSLLWQHAPGLQQNWFIANFTTIAADGSLHVAWQVDDPPPGGTAWTHVDVRKYDAAGAPVWQDPFVYSDATVTYPSGIFVDDLGRTVLTVHTTEGAGVVVYATAGFKIMETVGPNTILVDSEPRAIADHHGYPAYVAGNGGAVTVRRYGPGRDRWEHDRTWTWARPWVHPAGPPQFHDFADDTDDWIAFHARAGQTYRVNATAGGASLPGVALRLYSGDTSDSIATALPAGVATDTELTWTAPEAGTYQLRLSPSDGIAGQERDYAVTIEGQQTASHLWARQYGLPGRDTPGAALAGGDGTHWVLSDVPLNSTDAGLHRFASDGTLLSSHHYGGSWLDYGRAATLAPDGAPVVALRTESFSGDSDVLLLEIDPTDGSPRQVRRYDLGGVEDAVALQRDPDGDLYLLGNSDFLGHDALWLMRVEPGGDVVWSRTFADPDGAPVQGVALADGEVLIVAGRVADDGLLMKVSRDGELLWSRRFDPGDGDLRLEGVVEDVDGDLLAIGNRYGESTEGCVLRTDRAGATRWAVTVPGASLRDIVATAGRGAVAAGLFVGDDADGLVLELDALGAKRWDRLYGADGNEQFHDLVRDTDGGFLASGLWAPGGLSNLDLWTVKLDALGRLGSDCTLSRPGGVQPVPLDLASASWTPTVDAFPPDPVHDDPVSWGTAIESLQPEVCALHEPGEVAGPLSFPDETTISWPSGVPGEAFHVYRGADLSDTAGFACVATGLGEPFYQDDESPGAGEVWGYLVVAANALGEGPLGADSSGRPRAHPAACSP